MFCSNLKHEWQALKFGMQNVLQADEWGVIYKLQDGETPGKSPYKPIKSSITKCTTKRNQQFKFRYAGILHSIMVHRFVWMYFNRSCIPVGAEIIHKDGNKTNNQIWNMELKKKKNREFEAMFDTP
jgi:hypothetical protein